MKSMNWKWLILAPLTLTVLVACGDKDKKGEDASPYAGTWLRQSAWAAYNESLSDERSFCPRVYQRPQDHGINTRRKKVYDVAWRIDNAGEVYHWSPSVRYDLPTAKSYAVGRLAADGNFALEAPVAGRNAYQYQTRAANPYSRVYPVDSGRINFSRWNGGQERYVRVTQAELLNYASRLSDCAPNLTFAEYNYGADNEDLVGPQQDFQGPASPYANGAQPNKVIPDGQLPDADFDTDGSPYANGANENFEPLPAVPTPRQRH